VKRFCLPILLLGALAAVPAAAQTPLDIKPGLWESTMNHQMSGVPPIPDDVLAKMTPEQRARVEAAMKAHGAKGPTVTKYCLTPEMIRKSFFANSAPSEGCSNSVVSSSARGVQLHVDCGHGEQKSVGDMQIQALDSEHVKGDGHFKSSSGSRSMDINVSFTSKWLGSDCGSTPPLAGASK